MGNIRKTHTVAMKTPENKQLYVMSLYNRGNDEFSFYEVIASSKKEAIEDLIDQFNIAEDEYYRNPDYDPNGPLVVTDPAKGYRGIVAYNNEEEDYGPFYYEDFFEINGIRMEIYSVTEIKEI